MLHERGKSHSQHPSRASDLSNLFALVHIMLGMSATDLPARPREQLALPFFSQSPDSRRHKLGTKAFALTFAFTLLHPILHVDF